MEEELSALLRDLHDQVGRGGEPKEYEDRVHVAAARLHGCINKACEAGYEVSAQKDNGRVLRIGVVGPINGTRFRYGRFPRAGELREQCELIVIKALSLSRR